MLLHSWVIILLVGCWSLLLCDGHPNGAPKSVCSTMTPEHKGLDEQFSESKYVVEALKMKDGNVRVRIYSKIGEDFQGFALQARSARDRTRPVDGHFTSDEEITITVDCFQGADNMLTHVRPTPKKEVVTEWWPNVRFDEDVIFRATVAKTFSEFWTEVDSEPLRIAGYAMVPTTPDPKILLKKIQEEAYNKVFEKCFETKGCFGMPSGCVPLKNCQVLLTYALTPERTIFFKMHSRIKSRSYAAMALSTDTKMGDDLVYECLRLDSIDVALRETWNSGKSNVVDYDQVNHGIKYLSKYVDGVLTCSWEMSRSFDFNGIHFDLENSTHLLLAEGPIILDKKGIHRNKIASSDFVNFTSFDMVEAARVATAIKVHGALMVIAWIGFVSFGILVVRYFKDAWPGRTMCKKKVWFALHRCSMVFALFCVLVSIVIIFVHYNGWNSGNTHSIVGIIAVVLGFLQPIIANFRPDPESPKRTIFNWLHRSVGTLAHLCSLVTLYLASKMESSGLDRSFYWVLTIFVVVYLFFHVVLHFHLWKTKKMRIYEIDMLNMSRNRELDHSVVQKRDERSIYHYIFRVMLLCMYAMVMAALVVVLIVLIGKAQKTL